MRFDPILTAISLQAVLTSALPADKQYERRSIEISNGASVVVQKRSGVAARCGSQINAMKAARKVKRDSSALNRDKRNIPTSVLSATAPTYTTLQNTTCVLAPEVSQGDHYIPDELVRQDVRDSQTGIPLTLDIGLIDIHTCEPLDNAFVEIWSANASGDYSSSASTVGPSPGYAGGPGPAMPSGMKPSGALPSGSRPSGLIPPGLTPSGNLPSGPPMSGIEMPSGPLPTGMPPSGGAPSGMRPSGLRLSGSDMPSMPLPSGAMPSSVSGGPASSGVDAGPLPLLHPSDASGSQFISRKSIDISGSMSAPSQPLSAPSAPPHSGVPALSPPSPASNVSAPAVVIAPTGSSAPAGATPSAMAGGKPSNSTGGKNTYLRGGFPTDKAGIVEFKTIVPGTTGGALNHINMMVHTNYSISDEGALDSKAGSVIHIGQIFFPEGVLKNITTVSPYSNNNNTTNMSGDNDNDLKTANSNGYSAYLDIEYLGGSIEDGLLGYITVGVDTKASYTISGEA